ncbi:MAG: hypothetical protein SO238_10805, partial [Treponema sp.]|nr:hypothetical protein [Treponema sp.]
SVSRQAGKLTCGYPVAMVLISSSYLLKPSATDTAQATVQAATFGCLLSFPASRKTDLRLSSCNGFNQF